MTSADVILGAWALGATLVVALQARRLWWVGRDTSAVVATIEQLGHRALAHAWDPAVSVRAPAALQPAIETVSRLGDQLHAFQLLNVEQLIVDRAELQAVLFSMSEGLIIYDLDLQPVLTNPALRQMAQPGIHATMFLEPHTMFLARWEDPEQMRRIEQAMREEPTLPRTDILALKEPRQWLKRYSSPLFNPKAQQIGHVVIYHDVTAERQADQMRSEFITNASHELRTPVTSMKLLLESAVDVLEGLPWPEGAARPAEVDLLDSFLRDAVAEGERMHVLVNDLLDVSKLSSQRADLNIQRVQAMRVIEEAVATVSPQVRQREQQLSLDLPGSAEIMVDRVRLRQVLVNLLGNAVKYTPLGGEILLGLSEESEGWVFTVEDSGIGIPEEDLAQVFDRFYRVGRDRTRAGGPGGSGLGLSIVKAAVEAHGGQIYAERRTGGGTRIRFTLPAQPVVSDGVQATSSR
ncbi:MAG: PAS domain-containing protein [Candidatus Sericytochromatia bacterium]|nr:PAS domain-containing protein [Candidatus Tanganyikabacteria bacterium]